MHSHTIYNREIMYHIIIVDSVLANFLFFFKFVTINRRASEGPHSRARLLGHIRCMLNCEDMCLCCK